MKKKTKQILAGALALLISCSTLLNTGMTTFAAEMGDIQESESVNVENTIDALEADSLPELAEVREQLAEDEIVTAEDLSLIHILFMLSKRKHLFSMLTQACD